MKFPCYRIVCFLINAVWFTQHHRSTLLLWRWPAKIIPKHTRKCTCIHPNSTQEHHKIRDSAWISSFFAILDSSFSQVELSGLRNLDGKHRESLECSQGVFRMLTGNYYCKNTSHRFKDCAPKTLIKNLKKKKNTLCLNSISHELSEVLLYFLQLLLWGTWETGFGPSLHQA